MRRTTASGSKPVLTTVSGVFLATAAMLLLLACSSGGSGVGTVTRVTVGDTLVVTSYPSDEPVVPLFRLERDLVIGVEEGDDAYVLEGFGSITADEDGRIHISNQRSGEIRIFDADGTYVTRFGRRGEGPGEFRSNYWGWFNVTPHPQGLLSVEDVPALRVFDSGGGFQRSFDLGLLVSRARHPGRPSGHIRWYPASGRLVTIWRYSSPTVAATIRVIVVDEDLERIDWLPAYQPPGGFYQEGTSGFSIPFSPDFEWTTTGESTVVWGVSNNYRLTIHDFEQNSWITAVLEVEPEPVSSKEIEDFKASFLARDPERLQQTFGAMLNRAEYPRVKPFFGGLMGDDRGWIWVLQFRTARGLDPPDSYRYDVFDGGGEWLGMVVSPRHLMSVRGDLAYASGRELYPTIERYRIVPGER